jgi:hypothetical protein
MIWALSPPFDVSIPLLLCLIAQCTGAALNVLTFDM